MTSKQIKRTFVGVVKSLDQAEGIVTSIVNVLGIVDLGDDIIHKGAFTKTISEKGGKIRVLDNHSSESVTDAVAKIISIKEVGKNDLPESITKKFPGATGGLEVVSQYMLDDPRSAAVFLRISEGVIDEYSIGFRIIKQTFSKMTDESGKPRTIRNIHEVELFEISPVLWGMNQATATTSTKEHGQEPEPESEKEMTPDGAVQRIGDFLVGAALNKFLYWAGIMLTDDGLLSFQEYLTLVELGIEQAKQLRATMDEDVAMRPLPPPAMWFNRDKPDEHKAEPDTKTLPPEVNPDDEAMPQPAVAHTSPDQLRAEIDEFLASLE